MPKNMKKISRICKNVKKEKICWLLIMSYSARLENSVHFAIILQLNDRSVHGINRISPVKIQILLSIQLWRAA